MDKKKLSIVIGVLIIAVLAYLGYRYYVSSTKTGEVTITGTPVEFLKARNAYITSVIASSNKENQVIMTARQDTNLVTPPSPGAPLVLTNASLDDELYFVYYTKDTRDILRSRRCAYSSPIGGVSYGFIGGVYIDSVFPSVAGHGWLNEGTLRATLEAGKAGDPSIKVSGNKLEVTAELWCGEGASKVVLATGKAIVELQK